MRDGSKAIAAAISRLFPNALSAMCMFHVKQNVRKQAPSKGVPLSHLGEIDSDIEKLIRATTIPVFMLEKQRVLESWRMQGFDNFARYFEEQWLNGEHKSWSRAYISWDFLPLTNNSLERFNGLVIILFSLLYQLPLPHIFLDFSKIVQTRVHGA